MFSIRKIGLEAFRGAPPVAAGAISVDAGGSSVARIVYRTTAIPPRAAE